MLKTFQRQWQPNGKWQPSKGYSLCRIVSLAQKLKNAKTHAKNVSTTCCSCSTQKTVSKNETFLKIAKNGHQAKAIYSLCKIVTLSQTLKMQKNMLKRFLQHIAVVYAKNG